MPVAPPEIGPYRVLRPLGRGGMGTVLLAEDSRLGRLVALKTFTGPEAQSEYAREQLLREARAAAALSHPNIAAVHDVLDVSGQVVIVFEYVQGETLASRIADGPLSVPAALAIALQLAEGLASAHEHGVIHRDLKPSNVVITADGLVKVLDFGIARILPPDLTTDLTQSRTTSAFVGTIGYAAPEQCLGQSVDARADVFSLGVVLFEMLTGSRPFPGADATTVVRAMLHGEPPHLPVSVPGAPRALDTATRRALCADPARRPQTARAFGDELRAAVPGVSKSLSTISPQGKAWAAAAVLAMAVGTAALVASLLPNRPATPSSRPPVVAVMPLINASGDPAKDYLALGVAESLVTRLASLPTVTVLSRTSVAEAKRRRLGMPQLADELDATYLVDGSVQQAGGLLRITLTLIRGDGSVAWGDLAEGRFEDIFHLQTRLASALAQALTVQVSAPERASLAQQPTMNSDALAAQWRGRALLERRDIKGNLTAALASFDEALRLDPRYASAHAARGETLWARYLDTRQPEDARAATDAGLTALRLDPNSAEVRYTLAVTLTGTGQLDAAIEELQRALALRPNFEDARVQLGRVLARQGRTDEALAEFRRVSILRPNYAAPYTALGTTLFEAGRYREAAIEFERVTRLQSDNAVAHQQVGVAYQSLGDDARALESYQKALAIRPYPQAYSNIGAIYHSQGEYAKAVDAYMKAIALRPNARETHRNLGDAYSKMGRRAAARRAYERAVELTLADLRVNPRDARSLASLAVYLQKAGQPTQAATRLSEAIALSPTDFEVLRRAAQVHALAGNQHLALDALEAALRNGLRHDTARSEEEFQSLRDSPRFKSLVQPIDSSRE